MGRIKTRVIKAKTQDLMAQHPGAFSKKFKENKEKVVTFTDVQSKKLRNIIAGYVTRLAKKEE
ncbi:MAG: 30S ribosomal protein S17e [Candidatus Woesearchaeota archaeon]|nr:MAG: 30S ribosomal protein S17e [Candidatus Woesearchaeota archaeon]